MNTATYQTTDKSELSEKVFPYLVKRGLENISIRELCKGTGIVQGTLRRLEQYVFVSSGSRESLRNILFAHSFKVIKQTNKLLGSMG